MIVFKIAYWLGVFLEMAIRAPLQKTRITLATTERHVTTTEKVLLGLLFVVMFFTPLIYTVTNWLDFADYTLPGWMGWLGVFLLACAVLLFWRAHNDLKSNWSPTLEIFEGHTLVTSGIYRYIRHPMYASQWLWVIAQIWLLQNWLAGPINLLVFIPFYILRVRAEEKMMADTFGDPYREYVRETGAVVPKFK